MKVKIHLKDGRSFDYNETALFDDKEAGWAVLSHGTLNGNRMNFTGRLRNHYMFDDDSHIAYSWRDIESIEVAP